MGQKKNNTKKTVPLDSKVEKKAVKEVKKRPLKESEIREAFRAYFVQLKRKINLDQELEEVMWVHFKAAGFDDPDKFSEGTKHFGYSDI